MLIKVNQLVALLALSVLEMLIMVEQIIKHVVMATQLVVMVLQSAQTILIATQIKPNFTKAIVITKQVVQLQFHLAIHVMEHTNI